MREYGARHPHNYKMNPKDKKAVVIMTTQSGHKLGFVAAVYSGFMFDVMKHKEHILQK